MSSESLEAAERDRVRLIGENQTLKAENDLLRALLKEIREDWFYKPLPDASPTSFDTLLKRLDAVLQAREAREPGPHSADCGGPMGTCDCGANDSFQETTR